MRRFACRSSPVALGLRASFSVASASYVQNRAGPAIIERVAKTDLIDEINSLGFAGRVDSFVLDDERHVHTMFFVCKRLFSND